MKDVIITIMAIAILTVMVACTMPSSPSNVLMDEAVISTGTGDALTQAGQLDGRKKRGQQNNEPQPEWTEWTPGGVWPIPDPIPCEDDNLLWQTDCPPLPCEEDCVQ